MGGGKKEGGLWIKKAKNPKSFFFIERKWQKKQKQKSCHTQKKKLTDIDAIGTTRFLTNKKHTQTNKKILHQKKKL